MAPLPLAFPFSLNKGKRTKSSHGEIPFLPIVKCAAILAVVFATYCPRFRFVFRRFNGWWERFIEMYFSLARFCFNFMFYNAKYQTMTTRQTEVIKTTWQQLERLGEKLVGALFYDRLFFIAPEVRLLFKSPVFEQSKKLMLMLRYMIFCIDKPDELQATLSKLAQRHSSYHVQPYHYPVFGNALFWTLEKCLGDSWTDEAEEAWAAYYNLLSETMLNTQPLQRRAA